MRRLNRRKNAFNMQMRSVSAECRTRAPHFSFYSVVVEYFKRLRILKEWLMTYQLTFSNILGKNPPAVAENEFCLRQLFE